MAMNRRGFVFTTIAILIVIAMIFLLAAHTRLLPRTISQTDRVHTMDTYITNLDRDLPRVSYISGYRSLIAMEEHISNTGQYIGDFDAYFISVFTNGTLNGTSYTIMDNSSFDEFSAAFTALAAQQGIDANVTVLNVTVYQQDPWSITLNVTVRENLADRAGTARFNRTVLVQAEVPIESIKDPVYTIGTRGRAPHTITKSNVTQPYITADNDTTNLQTIRNNTLYVASTEAPSFLQRFSGNLSASPYGIESFVRVGELDAQGLPIESCKSVVDHIYFGNQTTTNYYVVNMDNNLFWIDDEHLAAYDAVGKTTAQKVCT